MTIVNARVGIGKSLLNINLNYLLEKQLLLPLSLSLFHKHILGLGTSNEEIETLPNLSYTRRIKKHV
jgi:hypothetical protein